ncbi:hypothetical protein AMS68_001700 [Peltaster fructicola]|uniref:Pentacotripeptide-repeat region of PRORP domain-containing protein n=1 Tax=Peltaster fructicola TaxID=286661 RepID=A0A6H0XN83_9PEZI|nr:hypothetical protein AMS68_001700 [Peltaster fructicola]
MSLSASHICTSCQRSLARDLQRRLRIIRSVQHRELSYTRLERQGAGQAGSVSNIKHPVTLSNGSTGVAYDRRGPAKSQNVPVGRYSRAPLEPVHLLQELPPTDANIRAAEQHSKRANNIPRASAPLHGRTESVGASWKGLDSTRDQQADRPKRSQRSNPVLQDIHAFQRHIRNHRNDLAWQHLCYMASSYKAEQLRVVRQDLNFERQLAYAVVEKINTWFKATSPNGEQGQSIPGSEQDAHAQADESDQPFDVCKTLDTLGLLSPGLIALVLCETLYGILKLLASDQTGIDNSKTKVAVQDILAIWYRALASQLQPERDTSFTSHHGDAVNIIDWGFLPQEEDLKSLSIAGYRSLRSTVELFLPVVVRIVFQADFTSAAVLTVHLLRQPHLTNGFGPEFDGHKPLLDFWSKVLDAVRKPDSPPYICKIYGEADHDVREQLSALMKERQMNLPARQGQQITSHTETKDVTPASVPNREATFAAKCATRISRAVEYHDAAQADAIFSEMLAYERHNEGMPRLPMSLWDHLVSMYMSMRKPQRAEQVLQIMPKVGWSPGVRTYTSLIRGSSRVGDRQALDRFWSAMIANGIMPDAVAYGAKVHALVDLRRPESALEALQEMGHMWLQSQGASSQAPSAKTHKRKPQTASASTTSPTISPPEPTVDVGNAMISALVGKQGFDYDKHIPAVLQWMARFDLQPDINTYNPLINNAMKNGKVEEALTLLRQMKARGIATNSETGRGLVTGFANSPVLDDLQPEEQTQHLLDVLDDIETNHIAASLDNRAYAILIDRVLNRFANKAAAEKLLDRMKEQGLQPTAHIYTILLDHYMTTHPPDYAAMETLWSNIQSANKGWGAHLDDVFFDRALERFSEHHQVLGIGKIISILDHLPNIGKRSSYVSLLAVAQVFVQRQEITRLHKLVHNLRTMPEGQAKTLGKYGYGHKEFWEYIISLGLLSRDGITSYEQLREIDKNFKRSQNWDNTRQSRSRQH